jgi:hypothetical protein
MNFQSPRRASARLPQRMVDARRAGPRQVKTELLTPMEILRREMRTALERNASDVELRSLALAVAYTTEREAA